MINKNYSEGEIRQQVRREMERDIKLARAKKEGEKRRRLEQQKAKEEKSKLFILNIPSNIKGIANKSNK